MTMRGDNKQETSSTTSVNLSYIWTKNDDIIVWMGDAETLLAKVEDIPATGSVFNKLINPQDLPERLSAIGDVSEGGMFTSSYRLRIADGEQLDVCERGQVEIDPHTGHKTIRAFLEIPVENLVRTAVSRVKAHSSTMSISSSGSSLEGRAALEPLMKKIFYAVGQEEQFGYFLAVGIDRISFFNQAWGANRTSLLIQHAGKKIEDLSGPMSHVIRVSGDVYGILLPYCSDYEAEILAEKIMAEFLYHPIDVDGEAARLNVSIGGTSFIGHEQIHPEDLISNSEMALSEAKKQGRGRFIPYESLNRNRKKYQQVLSIGNDLIIALEDNRVSMAYQPIVDSRSGNVSFYESLIRMNGKDGRLFAAAQFFPAIEELGLSKLFDAFAFRSAFEELQKYPDLTLSVNVSNWTLSDKNWMEEVISNLKSSPSVAQRMIIEITESAAVHDPSSVKTFVHTVKDLGVRVALDDFGAGYTSFSQIKELDVDIAKIDKQFIRNMGEDHNQLFVQALQKLAEGVNVATVGEGAETQDDADALRSDGVDLIQGYVYGMPSLERTWVDPPGKEKDSLSSIYSVQ